MDSDIIKLRATNGICFGQDAISLLATKQNDDGLFMASHIEYKKHARFANSIVFHTLDTMAAQTLMDDLWTCGVRPTEGKGTAGAMAATEKHLKDMRAIVSDKLKVVL